LQPSLGQEQPVTPPAAAAQPAETPKSETPKTETPKAETVAAEGQPTETPKTETPKVDPPATETPATEAPKEDAPATEAAKEEAPAAETPAAPAATVALADVEGLKYTLDTLWVMIAAFLVFWMNAGFGCVEAGLCRAKNATNILGKNFVVFGIATLAYWAIGFSLMYGRGPGDFHQILGATGWFLSIPQGMTADTTFPGMEWAKVPLMCKFFFQLVFAGTAATIVSGCVAERIHYKSFLVFTLIIVGVSYPITGHWIWGGGWLYDWGFWDFAGSTVVHSVGGWAGLVGILLLGPRIGKYRADGSVQPIPGHSMSLVFIGGLILWLGWFGFNPGSTMAADPDAIARITVVTNMGCCAGLITATITAWLIFGNPDFTMTVNGALAGLVAVTAPCAWISPVSGLIIGGIGGILAVFAVIFFDKLKIDDPVGALSVHLANGIWGTLSIGLFAQPSAAGDYTPGTLGPYPGLLFGGDITQLKAQAIGVAAVAGMTLAVSIIGWFLIKVTMGLRVDADHEIHGLDVSEMGMEAYPIETPHSASRQTA